jgi:DNA repair protein RadA/Sms
MRNNGLAEMDPASAFLSRLKYNDPDLNHIPGAAVAMTFQGSRAVPVEVQALVSRSPPTLPPRYRTIGISIDRFHVLLAVLSQRASMSSAGKDVYVNVVGGVKIKEPASDLALALCIASAMRDEPIPLGTCYAGEVGLGGELHDIDQIENRVKCKWTVDTFF